MFPKAESLGKLKSDKAGKGRRLNGEVIKTKVLLQGRIGFWL